MTWRNRSVFRGRQHGLWERHRNLDTRKKPMNRSFSVPAYRWTRKAQRPVKACLPVRALASCSVTAQRLCAVGQGFFDPCYAQFGGQKKGYEGLWISIDSRRRPDQGETHGALGDARLSAANAVATRSESSDGGHARPPRRVETGQRRGMFCRTRR